MLHNKASAKRAYQITRTTAAPTQEPIHMQTVLSVYHPHSRYTSELIRKALNLFLRFFLITM